MNGELKDVESPTDSLTQRRLPTVLSGRNGVFVVGLVLVFIMAPIVYPSSYFISVATQAGIYIGLALGLNMVVGYAGLLDLGYAAFFAIGAYGSSILSSVLHWPLLATLPFVLIMAIISALIIGGPTLRLRSDYLAIVTLGFGEIIQVTATNLNITGGATGMYDIPPLSLFGFQLTQGIDYYYVLLFLIVLFVYVVFRLRRSKVGRAWLAIREDEDAALAMGINTVNYKIYAYVGGAIFAAIIGLVYGALMTAVAPTSFGYQQSILVLVAVLIGGMGSIPGMIVGGILVEAIPEVMRSLSDYRLLVFGVIMIIVMIFRPQGIWPERRVRWSTKAK
ncbi:branched-chain amino acid ABC transporter permease [Alicyclobacillus sp. ALC3]|uniref:branched-chain amino acid ABC transporter permease n=1 Tax=Alicyclobacillus sp. ALC3 TaxID=2796143 RepID=UPI002379ABC8|nr:branched-chain amino acid ABC transporter permease [Alicyclobacillus sp. ALC3]